ncbi:hypothetical protein V2I01_17640 [Micromonospora sp. BRA006-A]|nr:hypothetical protein [Micromonospora sp. BRA006-A]
MITTDHAATLAGTWAGFTVRLATTSDDLQAVVASGAGPAATTPSTIPTATPARRRFYVWIAERDGDLVATGRAIPRHRRRQVA